MIVQYTTLKYPVECDLCGQLIPARTLCRIKVDARNRRIFFEHIRCPTPQRVFVWNFPIPGNRRAEAIPVPAC